MFKTRIIFLFLLSVIISSSSCRKNQDDPIIILSVDREFSLSLWENLEPSAAPLEIQLKSIEEQDCLNKTIHTSYDKTGNDLTLTIFEIVAPETCDPGNAPATGLEPIYDIEEGSYGLIIDLQEVVSNVGKLIVSEDDFRVEMNNEVGIKWQQKELSKVPETALWGYLVYDGEAQSAIAVDFINSLQEKGTAFDRADGYFGHFTIENTEITAVHKAPTDVNTQLFIQYYDGTLETLNIIVNDFRATAPNGMELHLFDGKGKEW